MQTEPVASPAILKDDNFLDPREPEYIGKWLKAGQFMPLSELKPGMQGYGLTVFQGNKIERFDVTVIGVVKKGTKRTRRRHGSFVRPFDGQEHGY